MSIRNKVKRTAVVVILLMLAALLPGTAFGLELPLKGESAILLDGHSGKILFEKEAHKVSYPASVTKLMTLVLAMEAIHDGKVKMTDIVTASQNAASYGGSQIFLASGEELTLKELLLGISMASGNDASVAVAEYIAGSHEAFVELMNKKAQELGLKNTHFVNCNGLHDPEHYTTAYDLSQIALYALKYPEILELCSVKHYRIREETGRPFQYDNKNKLLWWYEGADGFKTGWTSDAKYCMAATAERNDLRLISVVMGVPVKSGHFADARVLFDWGYSQYIFKKFFPQEEILGSVTVGKGLRDTVEVHAEKMVGVTVPKGEDKNLTTEVSLVPMVESPIKKGQVLGCVSILRDGQVLERTDLLAREPVPKGSWWQELKKVFKATAAS